MSCELEGKIFVYDAENNLKAYSNGVKSNTKVIFVAGLGCNLLIDLFTTTLNSYCVNHGYEFIMPQLRSQPSYGLFTIDDDAEDLHRLLESMEGDIVLIGNSTGCQDIMHYLRRKGRGNIRFVILQGAVSDVEYEEHINDDLEKMVASAREMKPDTAFKYKATYFTPERFLDLFSRSTKEDMFSRHLPDEFYRSLNVTGTNILFVISEKDQYAIKDIEPKLKMVSNSKIKKIPNGGHILAGNKDIEMFLAFCDEEFETVLGR